LTIAYGSGRLVGTAGAAHDLGRVGINSLTDSSDVLY